MPRLIASRHGETRVRMLRVQRRGDRHDPRDLTIDCRFEGSFPDAFTSGDLSGLPPGAALERLIYSTALRHGDGDIEWLGLAICARLLGSVPRTTRVHVDLAEQPWQRLEIGGRARGDAFAIGSGERRTARVTSNGERTAVVSGIDQLALLRTSGFRGTRPPEPDDGALDGVPSLLMATLSARWTYTSSDVTFGSYRQGVRTAIVETFALHAGRATPDTLYAAADVALGSYPEIAEITLSVEEHPYRPADLFVAGEENPDRLYVAREAPLSTIEITVERDGVPHP